MKLSASVSIANKIREPSPEMKMFSFTRRPCLGYWIRLDHLNISLVVVVIELGGCVATGSNDNGSAWLEATAEPLTCTSFSAMIVVKVVNWSGIDQSLQFV
jgi:hypothetical protein